MSRGGRRVVVRGGEVRKREGEVGGRGRWCKKQDTINKHGKNTH